MRDMKRYLLLVLFLLPLAITQLAAQEKTKTQAAPKQKQPLTYEAFFKKDMRKIGDVLPVYTNDKQYYLEIGKEVLGTDLLVSGIIVKGPWCGLSSALTDCISFVLGTDNRLDVMQNTYNSRIDTLVSDPGLVEAFKASNLPTAKFSFPIHAYGKEKNSYIIDITKDVTSSGKLFGFPNMNWVDRPVANRFNLDTIATLDRGVRFLVTHAQTDYMKGGFGMPGQDKHNTVRIEWTLQRLPESTMAQRNSDPRVGYEILAFQDYSKDPMQVKRETIIRRWDLGIKPEDRARYERGELVEPVRPILVYLDKTFQGGYREAAAQAIREWDAAFAAAGFKNVLRLQPTDEAPAVWGYHTIHCSLLECLPKSNTVSHPQTGEILGGVLIASLLDLDKQAVTVKRLLQAYEPKVFMELKDEVRYQLIRRQVAGQMGWMLGLSPNSVARYAYTPAQLRDKKWVKENGISSSAMDGCLVDFVAQPGDGIAFEDLFGHVSAYDRWALAYGYREYPAGQEKEGLRTLTAQAKNNPSLAYRSFGKSKGNPLDMTSEPLKAIEAGLQNLTTAWENVEALSATVDAAKEMDSWDTYYEMAKGLTEQYAAYMTAAFEHIGVIRPEPLIKGYNETQWKNMPRSEQAEAMKFLKKQVFSGVPAWMRNSILQGLSGYNGEETMTLSLRLTSQFLTNPRTLAALLETERRQPGKAYTVSELFKSIDDMIFDGFNASSPVDRFKCRAQYLFATEFATAYVNADVLKNGSSPVSGVMIAQMKHLLKSLDRMGRTHADAASRDHYRGLYLYLNRLIQNLEAKAKESAKKSEGKAPAPALYNGMCHANWE